MKVKFYADNFNARFTWGWKNGEHVTDDPAEIENLKGLGLRHESAESTQDEEPKQRKKRSK